MGEIDVLVVGAGPVGLTLACELARRGVGCRIIDKYDPGDADALVHLGQRIATMTACAVRPLVIATSDACGFDDASPTFIDPDRRTHSAYGADRASLYLVRPDGYIGFRSRPGDEAELVGYLRRHYKLATDTNSRLDFRSHEGDTL